MMRSMAERKTTDPSKVALRRQREIDAAAAMAEYHAAKAADVEKTARLRALRLAREAAESDAKSVASKPQRDKRRPRRP
jgi:hypothetical protein